MEREKKVVELLNERFQEWQEKGYIPSNRIEDGEKTAEPIRNRVGDTGTSCLTLVSYFF